MWWTRLRALISRPRREEDAPTRRAVRLPVPTRGPMRVVYEQAVVHEHASVQARILARGMRLVFKPLLRVAPLNDRTLRTMRSLDKLSARAPRSRFVEPVRYELGGVAVEQMTHRYGPRSDMTLMYLHGGGFFSCGLETHRRICERLALYTGATVVSVDYVQLPEGSVADSVQDAITAYAALADMVPDPTKIVVGGDSAGGYLTMKVAELATRRGLPAPAALLGFSPLVSLDPDVVKEAVARVAKVRDAYLPIRRVGVIRGRWIPEGAEIEGCVSPLDATEHISSPTFLVAVEDEMLRPEVEAMALLLAQRDVEVETHLWRGQVHAFPVMADALPESREALRLAAAFARRAVGEEVAARPQDTDTHDEPLVGEVVPEDRPEDAAAEEVIEAELDDRDADTRRRWFFAG